MDLKDIIYKSKFLKDTLDFLKDYNREKTFIAAGFIAQTIWNYKYNNDLIYGIDDIDLVYFNDKDTSVLHEDNVSNDIKKD